MFGSSWEWRSLWELPNTQTPYLTQSVGVLEKGSGEASYIFAQLFHFSLTIGPGQLAKHPSELTWAALPAPWKGPVSPQGCTVSCGIQLQGCWWPVSCSSPTHHPSDGHTKAVQVVFTFKVGQKNNSQTGPSILSSCSVLTFWTKGLETAGELLAFPLLSRPVTSALIPKMSLSGRGTPWGDLPAQLLGTEYTAYKQTTDLKCRDIFKPYLK